MCLRSKGLPPDTRPPAPLAKAGPQAETLGPVFHLSDNAVFEVEIIERPDRCRRSLVDLQRSAVGLIPKRNVAPHPEPLAFGGCDLVDVLPNAPSAVVRVSGLRSGTRAGCVC